MTPRWTPDLAVGVEDIDRQHEELFDLTRRFLEAVGSARTEQLLDVLAHLGGHIDTHFATEEALMRVHGYPGAEAHAREHAAFRVTFEELVSRFARYGDDERVQSAVEREVCNWLERHIATSDRALGEFLRGDTIRLAC